MELVRELQELLAVAVEQKKLRAAVFLTETIQARQAHPSYRAFVPVEHKGAS